MSIKYIFNTNFKILLIKIRLLNILLIFNKLIIVLFYLNLDLKIFLLIKLFLLLLSTNRYICMFKILTYKIMLHITILFIIYDKLYLYFKNILNYLII